MKVSAVIQEAEYRQKTVGVQEAARDFDKMTDAQRRAADAGDILVKQQDKSEKSLTRLGAKANSYINQQLSPLEKSLKKIEYGERLYAAAVKDGLANANELSAAIEKERTKYLALSVALNDNSRAFSNLSMSMTSLMSKFGGMTDITSMTARMSASLKDQRATLVKEAQKTGSEISSAIVSGMSSSGGMTDPTAMTRKMSQSANQAAKAAGLARHEWINLSRQGQDVAVSLYGGQSPLTVLAQQGGQIADVFASSKGGAGAALAEFGSTIGRYVINPVTAIAAVVGTASYAMYRWQQQTDSLSVSLNGLGRASGLSIGDVNQIALKAASASGISVSNARGLAGQYLGAGVAGGSIGGAVGITRDFSRKFGMGEDDVAKMLAGSLADPASGAEELARKFGLVSFAQREEINRLVDLGERSSATAKLVDILQGNLKKLEDPTWSVSRALDGLKISASNFLDRVARGILGTGVADNEFARQDRQKQLLAGKLDEGLARQLGIDKIASDASLAAQEITAQTFAQREAIAAEKGRIQALLDTKNATQHLMEAEAERLRLLADAQRKVDDYARAGARDRALSGARTPYERGRLQIIQEGQELLRQIPSMGPVSRSTPIAAAAGSGSSGMNDLVAEAVKRGLEPTEANFQKLIDQGVGSGVFRGRMVRLDDNMNRSTVNMPSFNRGAMEKQARAETAARLQDYAKVQQEDFTSRVNQDIEAQNRLLNANIESFGKSTAEVESARRAAELLNQAKAQGLPLTDSLNQKISEEAALYGDLAARTEEAAKKQDDLRANLDIARSSAKDLGESLVNAFRRGETAAEALRGVLDRLTSKLLDKTLDTGIEALLGKAGSDKTGSVGNIFGSIAGALGFSFLPKFADGGIMTSAGPLPLHTYAGGGIADRPQMALFGEGRTPEAFVPLPDGRRIPVDMQGKDRRSGANIQIINNASGLVDIQAREDALTGRILLTVGSMLKTQVPSIVADAQRRAM